MNEKNNKMDRELFLSKDNFEDMFNFKNRLKEFFCVIFGHNFNSYYSERNDQERIIQEQIKCDRCKLSIVKFYLYKKENNILRKITVG